MKYPEVILLEVGPGQTLSTLARQQPATAGAPRVILSSLRAPQQTRSPTRRPSCTRSARLWLNGAPVNWTGFYAASAPARAAARPIRSSASATGSVRSEEDRVDRRSRRSRGMSPTGSTLRNGSSGRAAAATASRPAKRWLVFSDDGALGAAVRKTPGTRTATGLDGRGWHAVRRDSRSACLHDPSGRTRRLRSSWSRSSSAAGPAGRTCCTLDGSPLDPDDGAAATSRSISRAGFHSLICLAQALEKDNVTTPVCRSASSRRACTRIGEATSVSGQEPRCSAPARCCRRSIPNLRCKTIDIGDRGRTGRRPPSADLAELALEPPDTRRGVPRRAPAGSSVSSPRRSRGADRHPVQAAPGRRVPDHRRSRQHRAGICPGARRARAGRSWY